MRRMVWQGLEGSFKSMVFNILSNNLDIGVIDIMIGLIVKGIRGLSG